MNQKILHNNSYIVETDLLAKRLTNTKHGDIVTYEEIKTTTGLNILSKRWILTKAIKMVSENSAIRFKSIRKVGIQRLSDIETINTSNPKIKAIGKAARRVVNFISGVDYDNLPNDKKTQHNTIVSIASTINHMSKPSTVKAITSRVEKSQNSLPLSETLEVFRKSQIS